MGHGARLKYCIYTISLVQCQAMYVMRSRNFYKGVIFVQAGNHHALYLVQNPQSTMSVAIENQPVRRPFSIWRIPRQILNYHRGVNSALRTQPAPTSPVIHGVPMFSDAQNPRFRNTTFNICMFLLSEAVYFYKAEREAHVPRSSRGWWSKRACH